MSIFDSSAAVVVDPFFFLDLVGNNSYSKSIIYCMLLTSMIGSIVTFLLCFWCFKCSF